MQPNRPRWRTLYQIINLEMEFPPLAHMANSAAPRRLKFRTASRFSTEENRNWMQHISDKLQQGLQNLRIIYQSWSFVDGRKSTTHKLSWKTTGQVLNFYYFRWEKVRRRMWYIRLAHKIYSAQRPPVAREIWDASCFFSIQRERSGNWNRKQIMQRRRIEFLLS